MICVGTGGLAAPLLGRFAKAAEFAWRIGHTAPESFPLHMRLVEAAAAIERESDGRMTVQVYPESQLGGLVGLLAQLRAGTLDASPITGQTLTTIQGLAALPMVGFAWRDEASLWKAMDGDLGRLIREQLLASNRLVVMERSWDFGFRIVTTRARPIRTAEDIAGVRIRTPIEADMVTLFQAMKALPLAMSLGDLYPTLQRHQADGQESVLPMVVAARLFEVQSYVSLTNHMWDGQWMCVAQQSWNRLPDKLKAIVAKELNAAAMLQREDIRKGDEDARAALTKDGMTFNDVDQESFRETLRSSGYYKKTRARLSERGWDVLERYAGRLA